MATFISITRIKNAIVRLSDWRGTVKQQSVAHIFPLLAFLEKGVNTSAPVVFEESDDFAFFDRYCKASAVADKPYFDPFIREFRISSHPHSNIATARKNTFQNRWRAATLSTESGSSEWKLAENFAELFGAKLFPRSGGGRINVIDVACWLFRNEEFPDNATSESVRERFRERFPMSNSDFDILFEYRPEPAKALFVGEAPTTSEVNLAIESLAFDTASNMGALALATQEESSAGEGLPEDDPILIEVKGLLGIGTSGIILRGAPGTGKSWYADRIALSLTDCDRSRIFRVQFHPSFTYEDFFDGYLPSETTKSGFEITGKIFRKAIAKATETSGAVVLLIDEINRGNTAKIFGEALTYIEHGWRNVKFVPRLGTEEISVPSNLIVLATMNPHDRSITPLDMALLRRFDQIEIPPNGETATDFLVEAGMSVSHAALVADWFGTLQGLLPFGIGHTFFLNVSDEGKLGMVWRYRILPFCELILEYEPQRLSDVKQSYEALERRIRESL
jgi:5-methylcytosine-specific restriction protein B